MLTGVETDRRASVISCLAAAITPKHPLDTPGCQANETALMLAASNLPMNNVVTVIYAVYFKDDATADEDDDQEEKSRDAQDIVEPRAGEEAVAAAAAAAAAQAAESPEEEEEDEEEEEEEEEEEASESDLDMLQDGDRGNMGMSDEDVSLRSLVLVNSLGRGCCFLLVSRSWMRAPAQAKLFHKSLLLLYLLSYPFSQWDVFDGTRKFLERARASPQHALSARPPCLAPCRLGVYTARAQ